MDNVKKIKITIILTIIWIVLVIVSILTVGQEYDQNNYCSKGDKIQSDGRCLEPNGSSYFIEIDSMRLEGYTENVSKHKVLKPFNKNCVMLVTTITSFYVVGLLVNWYTHKNKS